MFWKVWESFITLAIYGMQTVEHSEGDLAMVLKVRCVWKKFRELSPILNFKGMLFKLEDED